MDNMDAHTIVNENPEIFTKINWINIEGGELFPFQKERFLK